MTPLRASLESQYGTAPCAPQDTEEMFWLREAEDYGSKVSLGNALAAQYRFREAAAAYREAAEYRRNDPMLFLRLGGAQLTLMAFPQAKESYDTCLALGLPPKDAALQIGFYHYLLAEYAEAAQWFFRCLPCGDSMKIAAIYWHSLACLKGNLPLSLLGEYCRDMEVGHHGAYLLAVSVFAGETDPEAAIAFLQAESTPLNRAIGGYGVGTYLRATGRAQEADVLLEKVLGETSVWPCLSYLALWRETHPSAQEGPVSRHPKSC